MNVQTTAARLPHGMALDRAWPPPRRWSRTTSPIDGVGILGGKYTKEEAGRIAAGLMPR